MAVVSMKFTMIVAVLVFTQFLVCQADNTTADKNKSACAAQGQPININVCSKDAVKGAKGDKGEQGASCNCNSQKPSAHIEAANLATTTYSSGQVIKDWSTSAPYSHLAGGMTYKDGKLTVPTPGRYYIYAQLYYYKNGRVYINVNNSIITMIHPLNKGTDRSTLYTGGVFTLKAGDAITLKSAYTCNIYMYSSHAYFGAFQI